MSDSAATTYRYCGRLFAAEEMEQIRVLIAAHPQRNRVQLSRQVCDQFGWLTVNGRRKEMSCRVAMLRMERDGLIRLPRPQKGNGNGRNRPKTTSASDPPLLWRPQGDWVLLEFRRVQQVEKEDILALMNERTDGLDDGRRVGVEIRNHRDEAAAGLVFAEMLEGQIEVRPGGGLGFLERVKNRVQMAGPGRRRPVGANLLVKNDQAHCVMLPDR